MYNAEKVKVWYSKSERESDYYFVGGVEKSLIEQVREIVEPGFTNTELLPWMTAAAAEQEMISFNEGSLVSDEEGWWMPNKKILVCQENRIGLLEYWITSLEHDNEKY